MPPDPTLIVQTVLQWVVPGVVIIIPGFRSFDSSLNGSSRNQYPRAS